MATCEEDSYPSWKYLKWVTDNSATSNVKFYGKVAKMLRAWAHNLTSFWPPIRLTALRITLTISSAPVR